MAKQQSKSEQANHIKTARVEERPKQYLTRLPDELLLMIVKYLPLNARLSLLRVNKSLSRIVSERLFTFLTVTAEEYTILRLRKVVESEVWASQVRYLRLNYGSVESKSFLSSGRAEPVEYSKRMALEYCFSWLTKDVTPGSGYYTLPNAKYIELKAPGCESDPLWGNPEHDTFTLNLLLNSGLKPKRIVMSKGMDRTVHDLSGGFLNWQLTCTNEFGSDTRPWWTLYCAPLKPWNIVLRHLTIRRSRILRNEIGKILDHEILPRRLSLQECVIDNIGEILTEAKVIIRAKGTRQILGVPKSYIQSSVSNAFRLDYPGRLNIAEEEFNEFVQGKNIELPIVAERAFGEKEVSDKH